MKILITGAAGFLGLHLTRQLSSSKGESPSLQNQLTLLDIAPFDPHEYTQKNIIKVCGDVRDPQIVSSLMKDMDYVIHAAAALPLWSKEDIYTTNINGTENILKQALKNKIKHVIYISSTAVYGVPKKHPIYETDPMVGVGAYGESKIQAERLCREYQKKGLIVTILRPKTFIGTHRLGVFEILFDWVKDGKKIPVLGNGKNRYQLMDVDDLVEGIEKILVIKNKQKVNDVFNIAAKEFSTVESDLQALFDYAESGSTLLKTPAFLVKKTLFILEKLHLSPLYQWVYETADKDSFVSLEKLEKTINWKPKYSNKDAFIKSYQWYEKNYKEIKSRGSGTTHTVGWKQGILGVVKKFM